MNKFTEIIAVPFGYLLDYLYQFTTNYGVALILFPAGASAHLRQE